MTTRQVRAVLVPHSHWDREWYEPFAVFRERMVDLLDGVIAQLAAEPAFAHFHLDGQTIMIDDYLEVRPERAEEVAALVRSGRLSAGPMLTLADTCLVSGEGLVRNLECGMARAAAFGAPSPPDGPWVAYLPDQFGHVGQLPQVLRAFGIERAVVLRGVPALVDRSCFRWRSPDGSEVLADYLIHGYYLGADIDDGDDDARVAELRAAVALAAAASDRDVVLVMVGADHSRPVPGMFERALGTAVRAGIDVEVASLARFAALAPAPPGAAVVVGELRAASTWILLPNTASTRAHLKRRRGDLEVLLERYAEPLAAWLALDGQQERLDLAWRMMLENAEHDATYGACDDRVAHDVAARFDAAERAITAVLDDARRAIASRSGHGVVRWNPSPFERDGVAPLGWAVLAADEIDARRRRPVELGVERDGEGDWLVAGDVRLAIVDEDDVGDLFTFCPSDRGTLRRATVEAAGGRAIARVPGCEVDLAVTRGDDGIVHLALTIRNESGDHRLRLWVQVAGSAAHASAALSAFEIVERPLVGEGYGSEPGSPTWPALGAVLAGSTAVVGRGAFEYEVVGGATLAVTLLRASGRLAAPTLPTRPIWAGPHRDTPEGQCIGTWHAELGVRHGVRRDELVEVWERAMLAPFDVPAADRAAAPAATWSDVGVDADGCALASVRRRDGALELRWWNSGADVRTVRVGGCELTLGPARIEVLRLPSGQ